MPKTKKKLRSISHYVGDRRRMFEEMFNSIPQSQIQSLIPRELQCMPYGELKAELLILLLQMPEKDIRDAMEGRKVVGNVTLSDDEEDEAQGVVVLSDEETKPKTNKAKREVISDDEDVLEINIEESEIKEIERSYQDTDKKVKLEGRGQNRKRKWTKKGDTGSDDENSHKNKSLLELLELELRAKAIRSLLRKEQDQTKAHNEIKDANEPAKTMETNYFELVSSDEDDVIPIEETLPEIELSSESEVDEPRKDAVGDNVTVETDIRPNDGPETENGEQSWTDRWLHSDSVKNVVATSKMLTTVRKKILNKFKEKPGERKTDCEEGASTVIDVSEIATADNTAEGSNLKAIEITMNGHETNASQESP